MKMEGSHFVENYRTFENGPQNIFLEKNKRVIPCLVKKQKQLLA